MINQNIPNPYIWLEHDDRTYTTEASMIEHSDKPRNLCPKCGKPFSKIHCIETITDGEETKGWKYRHICGAKITVFND
jgi:hypothetical protein